MATWKRINITILTSTTTFQHNKIYIMVSLWSLRSRWNLCLQALN
jgi:hypothetical protein